MSEQLIAERDNASSNESAAQNALDDRYYPYGSTHDNRPFGIRLPGRLFKRKIEAFSEALVADPVEAGKFASAFSQEIVRLAAGMVFYGGDHQVFCRVLG